MKKILKIALMLSATAALFCSCDPDDLDKADGVAEIKSISFAMANNAALTADYQGTIGVDKTIKFVMPTETNFTALVPVFTVSKDDVVTVGTTILKSGETAIDCSKNVVLKVADAKSNVTVEYTLSISQNDGKAELLSVSFLAADNAGKLDADYSAAKIEDLMIVRVKGGAAGKTLKMKFTAGFNDVVKVGGVAAESEADVDCDFPIDIVVSDPVASVSKTYVVKVGKILESFWTNVGSVAEISGSAYAMALDTKNDVVYLAYGLDKVDGATTTKSMATVSKWNGTAFSTVGSAQFSGGQTTKYAMAVGDGNPYVMFEDYAAPTKQSLSVMVFKNNAWSYVGNQGFGDRPTSFSSYAADMVIDPVSKQPITASTNNAANATSGIIKRGLNVNMFDGSTWTSSGAIAGRDLALMGYTPRFLTVGNAVYLLVANQGQLNSSIYKYSDKAWSVVADKFAPEGSTTLGLYYAAMKADSKGQVYIAIYDNSVKGYIQLFKVVGNTIEKFGPAIIDELDSSSQYDFEFDKNDMPVVAYRTSTAPNHVLIISMDPETKTWSEPFDCGDTEWGSCPIFMRKADNGNIYMTYGKQNVATITNEDASTSTVKTYELELFKYAPEADILPE